MIIPQAPVREAIQGDLSIAWLNYFSMMNAYLNTIPTSAYKMQVATNDADAASHGVPLYGFYIKAGGALYQRHV